MNIKKLGIGAATAAAVGVMILGAASFANADDTSPSATSSPSATAGARDGNAGKAGKGGPGGMAGHGHTDATADEAAKVTAAVQAKDAAVTVTKVMKDDDGSFDVMGTKDNATVMVEVSADLATIEVRTGGPGGHGAGKGGPGGMAGHGHTDATADEAAKVTAAVLAKDAAVTVTKVMKDDDGSFDVMGTKDNAPVMVEVSADLATIEVRTGGPGGPGKSGHGGRDGQGRGPGMGQDGTDRSKSSTAPSSAATT